MLVFEPAFKKAIELVKSFEGFSATVYNDVAGIPTIGYGHVLRKNEKYDTITQAQALDLLTQDLRPAFWVVVGTPRPIDKALNNDQLAALTSLVFNIGAAAYEKSSLYACLTVANDSEVPKQFLRWCKAKVNGVKVVVKGLQNRRRAELAVFQTFQF